ncbi:hypothetical protein HGRIS_013869 [Hohenbuehelia grisea]|uniref:Uncharacterized protein n=1 Tax=Hohenbuehelia grisea TaxID=104357 RepID=A0ABR3IWQ8_9AGAR
MMIVAFAIPGPYAPSNIESFAWVSFQEMMKASDGIWMYDILDNAWFAWHAWLVIVTADMMGSAKVNGTTGVSGVHGNRFSTVEGARASDKGKQQYYPITNYEGVLARLANAKNDKERKEIAKETGIIRLPLLAASFAHIYPYFFTPDCLHQFYANNANHLHRLMLECGHLPRDKAEKFGYMLETAKATLPATFCGPICNIHTKLNTSYKLFEWMAVVHWYTIPFLISLGVNNEVVSNYAMFVRITEFSMEVVPRTESELRELEALIIDFLTGFERLYITDPSQICRARITLFQLIHIPNCIR